MSVRPRRLPTGWYPGGRNETIREIESFIRQVRRTDAEQEGTPAAAGIAPHAGWAFSGAIACRVVRYLSPEADTVVVVGGHLGPGDGIVAAFEERFQTPLGEVEADLELLNLLRSELPIREDVAFDNTVEVQLPLVRYFFPSARVLALRVAPTPEALQLGEALAAAGARLPRRLRVLGSTDLTHYGSNYGFSPRGGGPEAVRWVKEVNDRRLIDSLLSLHLEEALERGRREHSACSVGAAACAGAFAARRGSTGGRLLEYRTSYDVSPGESFVGYAGIIYPGSA